MHSLDVPVQIRLLCERLVTFDVIADEDFTKMTLLIVLAHVPHI